MTTPLDGSNRATQLLATLATMSRNLTNPSSGLSVEDRRQEIISKILNERLNQLNLPYSEYDVKNTPNDWVAIITSYCSTAASRKHSKPSAADYEKELVKAAAVILAALENLDNMVASGTIKP